MGDQGHTDGTLSISRAVSWAVPLWWTATRRRWRQHGSSLLMGGAAGVALALAARAAPPGGEPLYLTLLLAFACAAVIASPLVLNPETVLSSRRLDLLPITLTGGWTIRILLGNSLRTVLAAVILIWGTALIAGVATTPIGATVQLLQLAGWVTLALTASQLLEDVIRHRRAVVLHQLVFLLGIAFWPLFIDALRDDSNFVPPPRWAEGPVSVLLITTPGPPGPALIGAFLPFALAALLIRADQLFLRRRPAEPSGPAASTRWTATLARALAGPAATSPLLIKELVVPLRFLFLRMSLVFILLTSVAAFAYGLPLLFLSIPFWWQPLTTNMLGPDLEDGQLRYPLLGWSPRAVLPRRLLAMILLTAVTVLAAALMCSLLGWVATPVVGPPSLAVYPMTILYSLTLLALFSVGLDRYSLRFSDALEMHTLLPERKRSGGAGALVMLFAVWMGTGVLALAGLGAAFALVSTATPGELGLVAIAAVAGLAGGINIGLYALHARSFLDRDRS